MGQASLAASPESFLIFVTVIHPAFSRVPPGTWPLTPVPER